MRQFTMSGFAYSAVALAAVLAGAATSAQPAIAAPNGFHASGAGFGGGRSGGFSGRSSGGSSFGGGRSLGGGSFGGGRSFGSSFGSGRSFGSNSFGGSNFGGRSFSSNSFGSGRSFSSNSFGSGRSFSSNSFGGGRSFSGSNFGGRSFGNSVSGRSFSGSPFRGGNSFSSSGSRISNSGRAFQGSPGFSSVTGRAIPGRSFAGSGLSTTGRVFRGATPFPDRPGRIPVYTAGGQRFIGRGEYPYPGFGGSFYGGREFGPGYGFGGGYVHPAFLGGYYCPSYVDVNFGSGCYPSVFGLYLGFPHFVFGASFFVGNPYVPYYVTPYIPFECAAPATVNNYYYNGPEDNGVPSTGTEGSVYPTGSYQAAFADIQRGWSDGNIALIRKHLRDSDTKISVFVNRKYSYTIAGSDFTQITHDALDHLDTVSFQFLRLRKAQNGDVTAYATHTYRSGNAPATDPNADVTAPASTDNTQPMDQSDNTAPSVAAPSIPAPPDNTQSYDSQSDPNATDNQTNPGSLHTVYVSYTLRKDRETGLWFIVAVDSSTSPLVDDTSDSAI